MNDISFDKTSAILSIELLEANLNKIKVLESETEYHYRNLNGLIVKALIALDWKPYYNEKAIKINLTTKTASYVWFIEHWQNEYTFKESPAEFPYLKNGYRQDVIPQITEDNTSHWCVLFLYHFFKKFAR
jgi:hypothetical protein